MIKNNKLALKASNNTNQNQDYTTSLTSLRIAELTGKKHSHIMRDIRKIFESLGNESKFGLVEYKDEKGENRPMYLLDESESLTLASGYNVVMRKSIIDSWLEMKNQELKVQPVNLPNNYLEALKSLIVAEEAKQQLQSQNLELKTQLDELTDYVSIIKVANYNKVSEKSFNWRLIKAKSIELDYPIKKAQSPRFGFQNLYSIKAFKTVYPEFDYCFENS
jgi:phage regulator Rha-like protein